MSGRPTPIDRPIDRPIDGLIDRLLSAKVLFVLAALFIVYATTVPFHFDRAPTLSDAVFNPFWDPATGRLHSIPDVVQNIILFVPFGFFAVLGWPGLKKRPLTVTVFLVGLLGLALSTFVEALQTMSTYRRASANDLATNTIGAATGAFFAWQYRRHLEARARRWIDETRRSQPGLFVLMFFAGECVFSLLAPFIPTLDVGWMRGQVRGFLTDPWGGAHLAGAVGQGLMFSALAFVGVREVAALGRLLGFGRRATDTRDRSHSELSLVQASVLSAACAVLFAVILEFSQLPLLHHRPSLTSLLVNALASAGGAVTGFVVAVRRGLSGPAKTLGETTRAVPSLVLAYGFMVPVLRALSPFEIESISTSLADLDWQAFLPFWSFFRRITPSTFINVFEIALAYVCLGFALRALGRSLLASFGVALILGEVLELLQIPIAGRTFDITEGLLAALGALAGAYALERSHFRLQPSPRSALAEPSAPR